MPRCLAGVLDLVPKGEKIPHPLWSMEFVATYCYEALQGSITVDSLLGTETDRSGGPYRIYGLSQ